jgi:hypothetical protein
MCLEDTSETYPAIVLESNARLIGVGCFDKDKFMFPHFIQNALLGSCRLHWNKTWLGPRMHTMSFQAATMDSM